MYETTFEYRFPSGFALAKDLLWISKRAVAIPAGDLLRDIFVLQHMRCHRFFAAGIELCRVGYAIETEPFMRIMLEALITMRYILLDPEHRANMFRNYAAIEEYKQAEDDVKAKEGILEHVKKESVDKAEIQQARDEYTQSLRRLRELKDQYSEQFDLRKKWRKEISDTGIKPVEDSWSFLSNYAMAVEANMGITFLLMYKSLSEAVHPTLRSADKYRTKQGRLMFSPSHLGTRRDLMRLTTIHMEMVRTTATYYNMTDVLAELDNIGKLMFEIKDSDEMNYDDPVVGLT
jgi:hypothetical protein